MEDHDPDERGEFVIKRTLYGEAEYVSGGYADEGVATWDTDVSQAQVFDTRVDAEYFGCRFLLDADEYTVEPLENA